MRGRPPAMGCALVGRSQALSASSRLRRPMRNSSTTIGSIAAALAKAQCELANPEKSMTATVASAFPGEASRTFRYAPLASGLDIVRKMLGKQEIATVQSTAIDPNGYVRLTTTLAHSSGEWVSSDWPVCSVNEAPPAMGAALTYARRYALFSLVGIAGEDDLDAPSLRSNNPPSAEATTRTNSTSKQRAQNQNNAAHPLNEVDSETLRQRITREFANATNSDQLARFAYVNMASKNRLRPYDALEVERVFETRMTELDREPILAAENCDNKPKRTNAHCDDGPSQESSQSTVISVTTIQRPLRRRNKKHLQFVASQPCLVCQRSPSDA
ncbi:MAG: single-stranded DNA-binding protein, partial [Alphaproteobacteria bacterium]